MGAKMTARAYLAAALLIAVGVPLAPCSNACSNASTPSGITVSNPGAAKTRWVMAVSEW